MKASKSEKSLITQTEGLLIKLSERALSKLEKSGFHDPYLFCHITRSMNGDGAMVTWAIYESGREGGDENKLISKRDDIDTLSEALESIDDISKERQLRAKMFKLQNEIAECERSLDELEESSK